MKAVTAVGAHLDEIFRLGVEAKWGQSHPARLEADVGGCAFNVAAALSWGGSAVAHVGLVGSDAAATVLSGAMERRGVRNLCMTVPGASTGRYTALVAPDGSVAMAAACMAIYEHMAEVVRDERVVEAIRGADVLVLDANGSRDAQHAVATLRGKRTMLALLATSPAKAASLALLLPEADLLIANEAEWSELAAFEPPRVAFVTDGPNGARAVIDGGTVERLPARDVVVRNVIGAGDAFSAAVIGASVDGRLPGEALERGLDWAARCVASPTALGWLDGASEDEGVST